jgi:small GTP-binding protein
MRPSYNYKVSLIGRSGVGKSSFAHRLVRDSFVDNAEATIGASFLTKRIDLKSTDVPSEIALQIWDTAGQERYHSLVPMYTRGAHVILLFTESTNVNEIIQDFKTFKLDEMEVITFIVVPKLDLIKSKFSAYANMQQWCIENDFPSYFISSKSGEGIDELLEAIKDACIKQVPIEQNLPKPIQPSVPEDKPCCPN